MKKQAASHLPLACAALAAAGFSGAADAISFSIPWDDENSFEGVLNTTITAGASWRMEDRSANLVGKANNNPNLCGRAEDGAPLYQSCQGLFKDQIYPAQRLVSGAGQFSQNNDDGNLNYDEGDIVQAPIKVTQDLTISFGDFGLFAKGLFFYDVINNDFEEFHPNRITSQNYLDVGVVSAAPTDIPPRGDSTPCGDRNPTGVLPCGIVYGPGAVVREKRNDGETLRQIGMDFQALDLYLYGQLPLPFEKSLTFKIGRQTLNWGESTLLAFGSINQVNPINANNFFRTGFQVEEVFTPVGLLFGSVEPFENATLEAFYQYEWMPLEAPAPGSFYSFIDLGTNNAVNHFNIGFGGTAEDPDQRARLLDNPLSGLTNTTATGYRLPDNEPEDGGQYGLALKYYAEWLNNGTELGFYFMNYHSRLPLVSAYGVPTSCAKETRSSAEFIINCPDIPLLHQLTDPNNPAAATDSAVNFDDLRLQFEYPEDVKMFGFSFNTTAGDLSFQGEVAYRPDEPLQVDVQDLGFAAFGPTLSNCHTEEGCPGTGTLLGTLFADLPEALADQVRTILGIPLGASPPLGGVGTDENGNEMLYPSSDWVNENGETCHTNPDMICDTYDLLVGHMVGSARAFPSFIIPYRGGAIGENPGCARGTELNPDAPCYIRGWEEFDTYQFNLGATYVLGATDNPIGADQIIMLIETGATYVPGLPELDQLQLEAPGTDLHASAGADGSGGFYNGASRRQACSTNPTCSYGADGGRFNPHQEDLSLFPDRFSWGYDTIWLIRYESVLPGISIELRPIWKHDVNGTAPGLATNFIKGRKTADLGMEIRYKSSFSLNLGYQWMTGGGRANLVRDRDSARAFVKFQF